jgi:hypothetical protein
LYDIQSFLDGWLYQFSQVGRDGALEGVVIDSLPDGIPQDGSILHDERICFLRVLDVGFASLAVEAVSNAG